MSRSSESSGCWVWELDGYDVAPAGYKPQEVADGGQQQDVALDTFRAPPHEFADGGEENDDTENVALSIVSDTGYEPPAGVHLCRSSEIPPAPTTRGRTERGRGGPKAMSHKKDTLSGRSEDGGTGGVTVSAYRVQIGCIL